MTQTEHVTLLPPVTFFRKDKSVSLWIFSMKKLCFILFFLPFSVFAQDTTPPMITAPARDSSLACSNSPNILSTLTLWYNNAAFAMAQDDSGQFVWEANLTLNEAVGVFINSSDTLCGNTKNVVVTFTAVDPSGNRSTPVTARFFTFDNTRPSLVVPPNVSISCTPEIRDTLIRWIRNKGGYQAADDCSNILTWTRFQYSISQGNTIIQTGGGTINNGPYPTIPNGVCNWRMNINFWVEDECGNETVTFGTTFFQVTDDVAPVPVNPPADVTVSCDKVPPVLPVVFLDGCTAQPMVNFQEINQKGSDPALCSFYRYDIFRAWRARDNCGNEYTHTQKITVTDTIAPSLTAEDTIQTTCSLFHPDSIFYTNVSDICSPVTDFTIEKTIEQPSCDYRAFYTYRFSDVCENRDSFVQVIQIVNDPIEWVVPPSDELYSCQTVLNFDLLFSDWLTRRANSSARSTCGELFSFVAVPGSYDINDPDTWPGIHPGNFDTQECPSPVAGFLRGESVDFVYHDACGQIIRETAHFGLADTVAPVVTGCLPTLAVEVAPDFCAADYSLVVPAVADDCTESNSPVIRVVSAPIIGVEPSNPDSRVLPVTLNIGPFNPAGLLPLSDANVLIRFRRVDMNDFTEFFTIFDEDNNNLGRTPNTTAECGDIDMTLTLPQSRLTTWMSDGFITLRFESNEVPGIPRAEINPFCGGSIQTNISFEIDVTNVLFTTVQLDQENPFTARPGDTISGQFQPGNHTITFRYSDCAGNENVCTTTIEVRDEIAPAFVCPSDMTISLPASTCTDTLLFSLDNLEASDACGGNFIYNRRVPTSMEASLITFVYNDVTNKHLARNKQFVFNNVVPVTRSNKDVLLTLEFNGNNNTPDKYFDLIGPDGTFIGFSDTRTGGDSCGLIQTSFTVDVSRFNDWIFNGQISFTAVPNAAGGGINPCAALMPNQTSDDISFLRLTMIYNDFAYAYELSGATNSTLINVPQNALNTAIVLNEGITEITFFTGDNNGNKSNCTFSVLTKDTTPPVALCKNAAVSIHPSGIEETMLTPDLTNNNSSDDCSDLRFFIEPSTVNCSLVNTDVQTLLIVEDDQGNRDSCTALVRIKPFELMPSFSSGLCENDTLKLFANLPPTTTPGAYTFHWKGPGNFEFFTENPTIPNVNESYSGLYSVTVTGFNMCITEGSIFVNIQPLTKPVLTASTESLCEGEEVILNTTQFTGNITYDWYEGIAPTGVRIASTSVPNLVLSPLGGVHFYYVIASGEDCTSSPSNLLKVTVISRPVAMIQQVFYSVCEGETITFNSTNTGNDLSYVWSGPGYSSTLKNPPSITNVGIQNQGTYTLVVSRSGCDSDTAKANVIILESPVKPVISSALVFCEGATFSLLVSNNNTGEKYEWYQNGVLRFTTNENSLVIPNVQTVFEGNWTVVVTKGSCSSPPSDIRSIAIDNLLEIGVINSGPICEGDSVQLQATFVPNASYTWQSPDNNQTLPGIHNPKVPAKAGFYSVTITTPTGCRNNAGTVVVVITPPVITALSSDVLPCMNSSRPIRFSPSVFPMDNSYTYEYSSASGFTSNVANAVLNNPMQKDTGLYTLIVYKDGCPSLPFTIPVRFYMTPATPEISGEDFYCSGEEIILENNVPVSGSDIQYRWNTPSLGQVLTDDPTISLGLANTTLNGSYTVSVEANGCVSALSLPFEVEVRPTPAKPLLRTNSPVCYGETLFLESDFADALYRWTGPDNFVSDLSMPQIPSADKKHEGWYVLYLEKNGCFSQKDSVFVNVNEAIQVPVVTGQRYFLCNQPGSFVEICIDPNSFGTGDQLYLINAQTLDTITSFNNPCIQIDGSMPGLFTGTNLVYVVTKKGNCFSSPSNIVIIELDEVPQFFAGTAQGNDIRVCESAIVDLMANHGPPVLDVQWLSADPTVFFTNPTGQNTTLSGLKNGVNTIFLFYSYRGCVSYSSDTISIFVEGGPTAENDVYTIPFFSNEILDITDNDETEGDLVLRIITPPASGTVTIENGSVVFEPDVSTTGELSFVYEICSVLCPDFCSRATVTLTIDTDIDCRPPSIITPNEDGINDAFIVPCLYNNQFPGHRLVIFNEWGNEVFSANDYTNDWKGLYNGNPVPAGTYFYHLDLANGNKPLSGFLIIQR